MPMLRSHHIVPLYIWVDDAVASADQAEKKTGRPPVLRDSEVVTILVFSLLTVQQQTLRQVLRLGNAVPPLRLPLFASIYTLAISLWDSAIVNHDKHIFIFSYVTGVLVLFVREPVDV